MHPRRIVAALAALSLAALAAWWSPAVALGEVRVVVGLSGSRPPGPSLLAGAGVAGLRLPALRAVVVHARGGDSRRILRRLRALPGVRYAEIDHPVHASEGTAGTAAGGIDPGRALQWGLDAIGAPAAWVVTRGGGVTVAVVDTGVAAAPDIADRLLPGWNVVAQNGEAADDNGHGTHVAGTIAEDADNGLAEAGVAPEAQILPVKVLDATGSGADSDVAGGIVWATDHGAKVINLSLGGAEKARVLSEAVRYARSHGVLLVAAAGNESGPIGYPARLPGVLAVGAVDRSLRPAGFSNRGQGLDIVAPGVGIVQQTLGERTGTWDDRSLDGTSMASPHVAAAAALVLAAGRATSPAALASRLERTAQDLGGAGRDGDTGYGLVRADLAVAP